jgi:2-dehydropantoate 2-reductase
LRFAIIGVGGVGGYFGARLAEAGQDVTFVARGAHREAIERSGLHVQSLQGNVVIHPARVCAEPSQVGLVDYVMLAVKTWQVADAARAAAPLVGPGTLVLSLQNGVEAPEHVARALGREHAIGGVAKIISFVSAPGHIVHAGADPTLVIGELGGGLSERVEGLRRAFDGAKAASVSVSADIVLSLWEKFLFITAWAGVGAVARAPMGVVRSVPETRRLIEAGLEEIERLARARGIALAEGISAATLAFIDRLPADGTASLQRDIAAGRPSELDDLTGAVVRLGLEAGVSTPVSSFIYGALSPLERRARGLIAF